ncbi:MAG TPA: phosphate-starvation-inducible PsiE family protein [Solirubrobacteraceae bacterium]|nr:phosphate-starvation-inducible PsiE family protein [Solirubrobacteraceae bacterium]
MVHPSQDPRPRLEPRTALIVRNGLWALEDLLYLIVGLLLVTAAVLVTIGTVTGLISAIDHHRNAVSTAVVVLDRVLLTLIVAELLHTLRFVVLKDRIVVEPFLLVGLIAVVRRILIVTAELERQAPGGRALTNYLLELGLLGFLTLALALAIYLVHRSGSASDDGSEHLPEVPISPLSPGPAGPGR